MTLRLGILISGGGSTMLNLHERIKNGTLDAEIACVISSRSRVKGVERARNLGYPTFFVGRKKYDSDQAYSDAISVHLNEHQVDLVILAGFLRKYLPAARYKDRCLNIHPALIPSFCGKGFYGMKVHEAVWQNGNRITGCTVHLVDEEYDSGPIIVQKAVPVTSADTPEEIAARVFAAECEAYPEAIRYFIEDRIRLKNGRAWIEPA